MSKYVNEMENYLYNHNYISENNNNIKQQELSIERASCIVQKHRTLTEEKDKEIERLNKDLQTAIDICNNRQKEIIRLNNIINKSIEAINTYQDSKTFGINYENIKTIRGILKENEFDIHVFENYLRELKEGK